MEVHAPFVRGRRLSMLAALALDQGIIASTVVEGSFNHDLFIKFLHEDLVCNLPTLPGWYTEISEQLPTMNPYPAPRSVILIDNAQIHHSQEVHDIVEQFGMSLDLFSHLANTDIVYRLSHRISLTILPRFSAY